MRVLVAFEEVRFLYADAMARALSDLRPALEVRSVTLGELGEELGRFEPHVVVCSRANSAYSGGGRGAWVEIPTEDPTGEEAARLVEICSDGEEWKTDGPALGEILEVIDRTQEQLQEGRLHDAC